MLYSVHVLYWMRIQREEIIHNLFYIPFRSYFVFLKRNPVKRKESPRDALRKSGGVRKANVSPIIYFDTEITLLCDCAWTVEAATRIIIWKSRIKFFKKHSISVGSAVLRCGGAPRHWLFCWTIEFCRHSDFHCARCWRKCRHIEK